MLSPAPQFRCTNQVRANILATNATFSGVTSIDVLGVQLSDTDLQQHVVLLRLPQPVDTGGANILVQGGVTVTDLAIVWAASAADVANGTPPPAGPHAAQQLAEQQVLVSAGVLPTDPTELASTLVVRTVDVIPSGATFSGVTSSDVLDVELRDTNLEQHVVLLLLPQAVVTGGANILMQGGVLVTKLATVWAASAADVANGTPPPAGQNAAQQQLEQQVLAASGALPTDPTVRANTLVVRTSDPVLNGIDFIEVLDQEVPGPPASLTGTDVDLRQSVLLVHLFLPVPFTDGDPTVSLGAGNISIDGGVRITNVTAVWAAPASALVAGPVTGVPDNERQEILDANDANPANPFLPIDAISLSKTLVVRTNVPGDFSTYELSIEQATVSEVDPDPGDTDAFNPPFIGFDRQLSRVSFSFKIECPTDFDCAPVDTCVPVTPPAPVIDYLSKDYASFRGLMFDRLAQTMPQWQETNVADLGVTLVELLAFAADQLSYFQDSVGTEAYLGTAQQRPSLRRHARLLDYTPREGTNARTFVHFTVQDPSTGSPPVLPAGSPLLTGVATVRPPPPAVVITPQPGLSGLITSVVNLAVNAGSQVFQTMESITLREAHNQIGLYTWGDEGCCLPQGATRATLVVLNDTGLSPPNPSPNFLPIDLDPNDDGAIKVGALLALVEVNGPEEVGAPPDPKHRQVVRLTKVRAPTTDPLFKDVNGNPIAVVDVEWSSDDALTFPLCLGLIGGLPISVAQANIVLADSGQSVSETLPTPPSDPTSAPPFRPQLSNGPLTFVGQVVDADSNVIPFDPTASGAAALVTDPQQAAVPSILLFPASSNSQCGDSELLTSPETWLPVSDLLESGAFSKQFVVETQNDGDAQLRFGDDTLGERPLEALTACYRIGNGTAGNIGADALVQVVTTFQGVFAVNNVVPAAGGTDPEPLEETRLSAPQAFRTQERAVTAADYSDIAQRFPGVQRAVAVRRFTGSWYTMFIAVDRLGGLPVDDAFKTSFAAFLERFRLAGYDLEIESGVPVPLQISLTVCVLPGFFRFNVKQALLDALSNRVLPNGQRGFFHPDNFTFGQSVFLSQIIAVVLAVPGVGQVLTGSGQLTFKRLDQVADPDDTADGVLRMQPLEIPQLDNDPSQPENGQLQLDMQGGA